MRYLLDTDICVYIARRKPATIRARWERMEVGELGMSILTYLDLMHRAVKSKQPEANLARIEELREVIPVVPLDTRAAVHYARIRTDLEKRGMPVGPFDLVVAAHALSLGLTLVTATVREFPRLEGLRVENWAQLS